MKWKIQFRENGSLYQTLFRDISGLPLLPGHECHCNRIMNHIRTMGLAAGGAAGHKDSQKPVPGHNCSILCLYQCINP